MKHIRQIYYLKKASTKLLEEIAMHTKVQFFGKFSHIIRPHKYMPGIIFVMSGIVKTYVQIGICEVELDQLSEGSFIGQTSILGKTRISFGVKVVSESASLVVLKQTQLEKIRRRRNELGRVMDAAERNLEKFSVPMIDYMLFERVTNFTRKDYIRLKFGRAFHRLVRMLRAAN